MVNADRIELMRAQAAAVERFACAPGACWHALFYYAVCGDWERFHSVGRGAAQADSGDALAYAVLGLELDRAETVRVCEAVRADGASAGVAYAAIKALLREGQVAAALALAKGRLISDKRDTPLFNLVIKYLAARGDTDAAIKAASASLECNPSQRDVSALLEALRRGESYSGELYLSPVPKRFPVSFYTPACNAGKYLRGTLEALIAQNYPIARIFVVDDGSTDDTAAIAREYPVDLIQFDGNRGLAAGRNAAFEAASTEFVGSVDADVSTNPDYTTHILMEFENASPLLAGVGGRLLETYTTAPADLWRTVHLPQGWYPWRMYFAALPRRNPGDESDAPCCPIFFLNGCNNIFRRSAVLGVGGYNEKYRTNAEDAALCNALRAAGYHVAFTRYAVARHTRRDSVQSVLKTAWNYGYWGRQDGGFYSRAPVPLWNMRPFVAEAYDNLIKDLEKRTFDCVYLDFLHLYVQILLDARACVQQGLLSAQQAARIQHASLDTIKVLDERHGGGLYEKARADCAEFFVDAAEDEAGTDGLPADVQAALETVVRDLREMLSGFPEALYPLLIGRR